MYRKPGWKLAVALCALFSTTVGYAFTLSATIWGSQDSANPGTGAEFLSVACASPLSCWAAGYSVDSSGVDQPLIESWGTTAWAAQTAPVEGTYSNVLTGISCNSATSCVAVGYYSNGTIDLPLAEIWNGSSWTLSLPPAQGTGANELLGVSCPSGATGCVAVGYYNNGTVNQPLSEEWSGSAWTIYLPATESSTVVNELLSVSCTAVTACIGVGYYSNGTVNQNLAESWASSAWTLMTPLNEGTGEANELTGVSCVASYCMAVGYYNNGTANRNYAEAWTTAWTTELPTNLGTADILTGVYCLSSTSCYATGYYLNSTSAYRVVSESWSGTSWASVKSQESGTDTYMYGVTCAVALDCWEVGYYVNTAGADLTFTDQYGMTSDSTATITPVAGTLAFASTPASLTFSPVTLDGLNQTSTATEALDIGDATGSGNGWNVQLLATTFTNANGDTLAAADLTVGTPTVACDTGSTCLLASPLGSYSAFSFASAIAASEPLVSAPAATGMGDQTVSIPWTMSFPSSTYAGTYSSTFTLTLVSGP